MKNIKREWLPCGGVRLSINEETVLFVAKDDIGLYFNVITRIKENM